MSFVHLHCHSEYSLLDGANRVDDLIKRAIEFEQPGLAITDHGNLHAAWTFQEHARKAGVRPIIGMEAYVAPGDRRDRSRERDERAYFHLVLLARDRVGYHNLVKLSSIGFTEGFYYKPRIDREVLARHSEGLIVSSACMAGEVARHLAVDDWEGAREAVDWYANLFDGRYYLEVQAHDTPGQHELNEKIFKLAAERGLPVIATNDAHFLKPDDHAAHDVLLCIGLAKDLNDPDRMHYDDGLYFKSGPEMRDRFPDRPDVMENTVAIAESCDVQFEKKYFLPSFPLPPDAPDENALLIQLTRKGLARRLGPDPSAEALARMEYELDVITRTGYAGYFLIVADFINWAKDRGIPVGPGRGSAAGSLVAWFLNITDIDPLRFDLLFERFLNPERVSMPDIDVDFCFERRGEVIDYVREKYGRDSVGQIITFGTMKSRAVVKDVGRALGFTPAETDALTKLIPNAPNNSMTVAEAIEKIPELRERYESEDRYRILLDHSQTLEGLSRHASVHAAGIVIAPGPLDDYVPVCTQTSKGPGAGDNLDVVVTQYDMNCLEKAGMLKMDFLGLKTLTVINDAVESIRRQHGALKHPTNGQQWASIVDVPLDDPEVFRMLAEGHTSGIFQFESALATDKLRAMRADRFDDLTATSALIRPGPLDSGMTDVYIRRKRGLEPVVYSHPALEPVLRDTLGVITYQEQVMRIANVLAGFTLAEADVLRKAVGKKDAELIRAELDRFVTKAVALGVEPRVADDLASQIETFGRYGFNKSHSAAYALLSYETAWLKAHYPAEFLAALLSSEIGSTDKVVDYISEARTMGVEVLPPHVNESGWKFTVVGDKRIRFGLGAIRGVGESAVADILEARNQGGPFASLFDFAGRIDPRAANKRVLESLIAAGALDGLGAHRSRMAAGMEMALGEAQLRVSERESGQESLFGDAGVVVEQSHAEPVLPDVPEWTDQERLKREKEAIGFFISGHPLERHRDLLAAFDGMDTAALKGMRDRKVEFAGVVTQVTVAFAKRSGQEYGKFVIEDLRGVQSVMAFGDTWKLIKPLVVVDAVLVVRGAVSGRDRDDDDPPVFVDGVVPVAELYASGKLSVAIRLSPATIPDRDMMSRIRTLVESRPGPSPFLLTVTDDAESARLRSRALKIDCSERTLNDLRALVGSPGVTLIRT